MPAVLGASICRGSSGYSSTAINTATELAPTSSSLYPPSLSNDNGISGSIIAGIVIGVLVVPSLALLAMCILKEKRRRKVQEEGTEIEKRSQSLDGDRVVTSLVSIAEVATRKKAAKTRLEQLEQGDHQKMDMRGALR